MILDAQCLQLRLVEQMELAVGVHHLEREHVLILANAAVLVAVGRGRDYGHRRTSPESAAAARGRLTRIDDGGLPTPRRPAAAPRPADERSGPTGSPAPLPWWQPRHCPFPSKMTLPAAGSPFTFSSTTTVPPMLRRYEINCHAWSEVNCET